MHQFDDEDTSFVQPQPKAPTTQAQAAEGSGAYLLPTAAELRSVVPGRRNAGRFLGLFLAFLFVFGGGLLTGWQVGQHGTATPVSFFSSPPERVEKVRETVIANVRPAVVQVNVRKQNESELGSGVIIDPKGYIVTNNHVVEGGQTIEVVLDNGMTRPAHLVGTAPDDDLAVLKVDPGHTNLTSLPLGDSSKLEVGQDVLVIGNPLGITQTVTSGIISALGRNVAAGTQGTILPNTIQTDAPINPGNSGGALVDMQGKLIGIPTLRAMDPHFRTPANGVGFAIPSNRVKFIVPQLIQHGAVVRTGRAALEVQVTDIDAPFAAQNNLPIDHGALVVSVTAGGAAAKAGIQPNDIIIQIDEKEVNGTLALSDVLINKNPGDQVSVKVQRGPQQHTFTVKLGELAAEP